jgi:signal transduction histidine kinase
LGIKTQEAVTGALVSAMVHPEDKNRLAETLAKLSPDNPMLHVTYRILRPDGAVIWVERNSRGYFDANGKLIRMLGMVVDITERTRAKEALAEMTRKLIAAQEQERARIGRELHDDINQRLSMLAVELDRWQKYPPEDHSSIEILKQEVEEISNDVQALSHDLHASKLEYLGVVEGMKIWCKEFAERQRIEVDFKSRTPIFIPLEIGHTLFRVLQEALHNVIKHSGAKRVDVQLWQDSSEIHLLITDPGRGFDVERAFQGRGLGLWSMRERVRLVNGRLSIESKPMSGAKIHICVQLAAENSPARLAV